MSRGVSVPERGVTAGHARTAEDIDQNASGCSSSGEPRRTIDPHRHYAVWILAPEHPDPYPVEDCRAWLLWTVEHARELGMDPDRPIIAGQILMFANAR
ncbi:alpha/beta hydrolase [Saccharopolyspora montiporae]|uniref:alpha/beta hydrolase n=1 Tax=Saccharopolyspora montiporae TaxID=2781240 RepID=UPI00351C86CF